MHRTSDSRNLRSPLLIAGGLFLILLFLPLLVFGPAPDPGIFYTGGRKLLEGGTYYHDILDIKPPFVYWYYALALKIFGESFFSIRLMDFLLQIVFTGALGFTLLKLGKDRLIAFLGVTLYALIYIGLGPENTTQIESYVGFVLLPAMLLHLRARSSGKTMDYALAGLCYGILLLLKPTLGLLLAGAAAFEFLAPVNATRTTLKNASAMFLAGLLPYLPWMIALRTSPESAIASEISTFIGERHIHQFLHGGGVRESLHRFMTNWNSEFGIGLLVLIVLGFLYVIGQSWLPEEKKQSGKEDWWTSFIRLSLVHLVALLLSCAVEFWFFPYHISRALLPLTILATIGAARTIRFFRHRKHYTRQARFMVACAAIPLIVYSPLARYIATTLDPARAVFSGGSVAEAQAASVRYMPFVPDLEAMDIPRQLGDSHLPSPSLYVISPNVGTIHALTHTVPDQELIHGHQLTSRFTLPAWRERFRTMIKTDPPDFMLIQFGDPSIGIQDVGSVQEGLKINGLWRPIAESYVAIDSNRSFTLFKHRETSR